jgi:FkbM family methyltransferase
MNLLFLYAHMLYKTYHFIIRILPFKLSIIKLAALLPPIFKSHLLFRVISNIATYCDQSTVIKSNLGINTNYKIEVSISHPIAAFGTPKLYTQEYATLYLLKELLKHSDAFIDVGANLGYFCFYMDEYNAAKKPIHFFEPDLKLFDQLQKNQHENGKNFIPHKLAISNTNTPINFYRNLTDDSSGSIKNTFESKHQLEAVTIDSISFDEFASSISEKNLLLKVDVEGAEFEFIDGASNRIQSIDFLIIELLQDAIDQKFPEMMIEQYKFNAYYINNFNLKFSRKGEYKYVSPYYNWLFTKYEPSELKIKLTNTPFLVVS